MKLQSLNVFTDGLIRDFHPLTVPNNALTDTLNATIITMNGNERILLNDMGNGRVESAFLPPGYVPVGMKEYGGIIYIASYNPITNKGLLGSFPSPERNIDLSELGVSPTQIELLKSHTVVKTTKNLGDIAINDAASDLVQKSDLFAGNVLRSGDKFGLYFFTGPGTGSDDNNTALLSNYNNVDANNLDPIKRLGFWDDNNKVYRNNLVTLSIEILDANNNLRDFTYLLKRYNSSSKVIQFPDLISPEDRFNTGYFIQNDEGDLQSFVDDVNKERNKKAVNTYNNKLFGKAFLVGKVNTIEYIEVSCKSVEDLAILFIVKYYYNTPESYLKSPKITLKKGSTKINVAEKEQDTEYYNKDINLYSKVYTLTSDKIDPFEGIVNFIVIPKMEIDRKEYYFPDIAVERSLDLSRMNNGYISLTDWRYFYTTDFVLLTWGMEAYPYDTLSITDLKFEFYDLSENGSSVVYTRTIPNKFSYNGTFTELISYSEKTLKKRHLYIVKISFTLKDSMNSAKDKTISFYRTLLTTPLYNNMYNPNHSDYLDDFGSDEALKLIEDKYNIINIEAEVTNLTYLSNPKRLNELDYYIYNGTDWIILSDPFLPLSTYSSELQSIVLHTLVNLTRTFLVENSISDKYPFDLNDLNNAITNDLELDQDWSYASPYTYEGEEDLIALDKLDTVFRKATVNLMNYTGVKSGDTTTFKLIYYFPSLAIFKQETNATPIAITNVYKNLRKHILDCCKNLPIIGVILGNKHRSGGPRDEKYISLTSCNGLGKELPSDYTFLGDIYDTKSDNLQYKYYDELRPEIKNCFKKAGASEDFIIVASPWATGYNRSNNTLINPDTATDSQLREGLRELAQALTNHNETDINASMKNALSSNRGHKNNGARLYWYMLLWKDTYDEYVVVNTMYSPSKKANSIEEIIDNIFGTDYDLYFQTNLSDFRNVHKIDLNNISYNHDYKVTFGGTLKIDVKVGSGKEGLTLLYHDSSKNYTNTPCITILEPDAKYKDSSKYSAESDIIKKSITFKYDPNPDSIIRTITSGNLSIYGLDKKIDEIVVLYNGINGATEDGYMYDHNNDLLTETMYIKGNISTDDALYAANKPLSPYWSTLSASWKKAVNENLTMLGNDIRVVNQKTGSPSMGMYAGCQDTGDKGIFFTFRGYYIVTPRPSTVLGSTYNLFA